MNRTHYLTIVRKSNFIDLYKYGYIYLRSAAKFDGKIESVKKKNKLFEVLTKELDCFEYSFEYLMLHFVAIDKSSANINNYKVNITDVQAIYVFGSEARREMEVSLGKNIQLNISDWSDMFANLQKRLFFQQSLSGIDNIWKIFDLDETDKIKCKQIIPNNAVEETIRELFDDRRPYGDVSIWVYLLRYERHNLYPRGMIGYFLDFIHILLNINERKELETNVEETTEIGRNLYGKKFDDIIKKIEGNERVMEMTKNAESQCNFHVVAPLYLFLRAQFAEGIDTKQQINDRPLEESIKQSKKYGLDFCVVAYLLGLTLGYDKTYEAYYNKINLPIFKKVKKDKQPADEQKSSIVQTNYTDDILKQEWDEKTSIVSMTSFDDADKENEPPIPREEIQEQNPTDIGPLFNGQQQTSTPINKKNKRKNK